MLKIIYNNEIIGEVVTNHSMTNEQAIEYGLGLTSITDQEELKEMYDNNKDYVFINDNGDYELDYENIEVI